jgi:Ca2+/H+ antiporter
MPLKGFLHAFFTVVVAIILTVLACVWAVWHISDWYPRVSDFLNWAITIGVAYWVIRTEKS